MNGFDVMPGGIRAAKHEKRYFRYIHVAVQYIHVAAQLPADELLYIVIDKLYTVGGLQPPANRPLYTAIQLQGSADRALYPVLPLQGAAAHKQYIHVQQLYPAYKELYTVVGQLYAAPLHVCMQWKHDSSVRFTRTIKLL